MDTMVTTLNIDNYNVYHVLVDSGSTVDILYLLAFSRMKLSMDHLENYGSLIQVFSSDPVLVERVITLPIKVGTYPQ